jgi:glycosyltransferase involved in cell wall biosynthesis
MKVVFFVGDEGIGRGEFYLDLAEALNELIQLTVVLPAAHRSLSRLPDSLQVLPYHASNTRRNPLLLLEVARLIRGCRADLVHTHFDMATEVFFLLNRFLKMPHIATKHNPRKGRIYRRCKDVIAVSSTVAATITGPRVHLIENGIKPIAVTRSRPERFTMVAVGRLERVKGFDLLIQAVAALPFDFSLKIVGAGDEEGPLAELIEKLRLTEKVSLCGFRDDVPQILSSSHLQVISSRSEGFSIAGLEGICYAPVVLSTPVGMMGEYFKPEFLCSAEQLGEAIDKIHTDYDAYETAFGCMRDALVDQFHLDRCARRHVDCYREVLEHRV